MGRTYAYIRVSSKDQNEARQLQALEGLGLRREHIFLDKQSGKDFCRPQYQRLLHRLRRGDLLLLHSIDRLGRNYQEILEPLLDTTLSKDLMGTFIADLVLQLLSFVAQNEREAIRTRQAEGIAAAKRRGVRFGRPPKVDAADFAAAYRLWRAGTLRAAEAAQALCVSRSTFYRHARACAAAEGQIFPARGGENA